jgi:hypothetical protein
MCFKYTTRPLAQRVTQFSTHLVFNRTTVLHCGISNPVCDDSTGFADKHRGCVWLERLLAAPAGKGGKGGRRGHFWQGCMWRVGQKIQYISVVVSIFSYVSTHLKIFVFLGFVCSNV